MQRRGDGMSTGLLLQDERGQLPKPRQTFDFDATDRPFGGAADRNASSFTVAQMRLSLPATHADAGPEEEDEEEEERLTCQDDVALLNQMFNKPSGGPSVTFVLSVACVAIQIPHTAAGTFFSPSVAQCAEMFSAGGSLVLVWMSCFWVFFFGLIFCAIHFRKVILPGAQLEQLGAGTLRITPKSFKAISTAHKIFYPTSPLAILIALSAVTCMVPSVIFGIGLHSAEYNRASALLGMLLILAEVPLSFAWLLTLRIAVVLSKDQVCSVVNEVRSGGEMSDDDWTAKVTEPTKRLAAEVIPTLSKGYGATQGAVLFICILGAFALYTLSISDMYWGARLQLSAAIPDLLMSRLSQHGNFH